MREPNVKITPMMQQYLDIKQRYPDSILFYRMGDFYEMFFEDAEIASRILEITLTSRDRNREEKVPMCGVPVHAADGYLSRLVQAGYRVAICEQIEDPRQAKGLVKRDVVRVITPGLLTDEGCLGPKSNNYIVSVSPGGKKKKWAIACIDISTGEFRVTELFDKRDCLAELFRLEPAEILLPESSQKNPLKEEITQAIPRIFLSFRPDSWFRKKRGEEILNQHFGTVSLDGFGLSRLDAAIGASGALLSYIAETQKGDISHIKTVTPYTLRDHLIIDEATKRNLELVASAIDKDVKFSLLGVLDLTVTPMGGRLLRHWILYPLKDITKINERLDAVSVLRSSHAVRKALKKELDKVYDLERLIARIVLGSANGRDLLSIKQSLERIPGIKRLIEPACPEATVLGHIFDELDPLEDITSLISSAIREDCPLQVKEGRLIKKGYNEELDELISIQHDGRSYIAQVESKERERTGISTLKVGFNKVFGYYIEVSKGQVHKVPDEYIRKQTLVNSERYITQELKEIEAKILSAQERRLALEYELFLDVRRRVAEARDRIQRCASALAVLDCFYALAEVADRNRYVRPSLDDGYRISIVQGRHPVVEQSLAPGSFVPNDIELDNESSQLIIITGPNMAGKSTVLRQTALITLMAQMGSFVPAEEAHIGIVDQIFTRVGATDYLARGQSTFMVEMSETAYILHNATDKSLVILDEIGRGTSTYDGLSIAWAVAEHLLQKDGKGVKTLFATHYHELTELEHDWEKVKNMHIAVKEWEDNIVFLRQLVRGATNKSYGIQVAALAGVPSSVIERAKEVLGQIEQGELKCFETVEKTKKEILNKKGIPIQMALPLVIDSGGELRKYIEEADIDNMTPIEALNFLAKLKSLVNKR